MPPVSGREGCPGCHPERSEGSLRPARQILRCAQDDSPYLPMSKLGRKDLTKCLSSPNNIYREERIVQNKEHEDTELASEFIK